MNYSFKTALVMSLLCSPCLSAAEPDFIPLLDRDHTDGWRQLGPGQMRIDPAQGLCTNSSPNKWGVSWYSKRMFADFIFRAEFKGLNIEFNSGVWMRFSTPGTTIDSAHDQKYEVAISHMLKNDKWPTGSIHGVQRPKFDALKPVGWNELEITAIGQQYTVKVNGSLVNEFTGSKNIAGYIGLEENAFGPVQFRNVRIKDLTAADIAGTTPSAIQTKSDQARIEVLKEQGLNAMEWTLAPLDETTPVDIRQNIGLLREDLLDEGKKNPKAGLAAYQKASEYCDLLLAALDQRELARVNAGYAAAQANADKKISNQQLDVSRNYKMSWPQYQREESQRAALRGQQDNIADVKKERSKVEWTARSVKMRDYLDDLYRQFREALRK